MTSPPAGAIGICAADSWVGRVIGWREDTHLSTGEPISHVIISMGRGKITDSMYGPGVRSTEYSDWRRRRVEWYTPTTPFTPEETRILRAVHHVAHDRIPYDSRGILSLLVRGHNRRRRGVYCSFWAAELYLAVRSYDFTSTEKPWNVGIRGLMTRLLDPRDFQRWYPEPERRAA